MSTNTFPLFTIESERVDRIPLILEILIKMEIQRIIDKHYTPHGNHEGLSVGWLAVFFLAYILCEENHEMCPVQEWVDKHHYTLERLTGQAIGELDFTDDRLGDVLRYLSADEVWCPTEEDLGKHIIRVYRLETKGPVRLDATTGGVTHDEDKHTIFKKGRNKEGSFEVQFKLMVGTLDPLGMPMAGDVVAGSAADDPLYVPIYLRIRKTLGQSGLLYIGDCKMGAIETRAVIVDKGDHYLMPLAMVGDVPGLLDGQLDRVLAGEITLTSIYFPEELPADPNEEPDPELAIAEGFEVVRQQQATLDMEGQSKVVTWQERLLIVRSKAFAEAKKRALEKHLDQAESKILALTPQPKQGKRQFDDPVALQQAADAILSHYKVADFFGVDLQRQVTTRHVRRYRDKPARTEEKVRYQVHLIRKEDVIERHKQRLGWRVYATNAPAEKLDLPEAVLAYRGQYLVERCFPRLKGKMLAMLPLFVQRDDHAIGMIRLLTVALRAMIIIEFVARRSLAERGETMSGLYAGNPKRRTARPTAELLMNAFENITLHIRRNQSGEIVERFLTPLDDVQIRILDLLGLSPDTYRCLTSIPVGLPLSQRQVCSEPILVTEAV
jgi:transposase